MSKFRYICSRIYADFQHMHITFIINPISGNGHKQSVLRAIERRLDGARFVPEILYTEYAGHGAQLAREAAARDVDIVCAVGGDGTVNEIAGSLVGTDTALAIIPCGSGNGLARHLCIPMDAEGAVGVINECLIARLDHGTINGRPFFCTCGVGFDAFISMKFAEAGRRGPITYVEKTLTDGLNYKPETYRLHIGDTEGNCHRVDAFLIACANASQYGNNAYIAPQASMCDGLLDVTVLEPFSMVEAPLVVMQLFGRNLPANSHVKCYRTDRLRIERTAPGPAHCDGEPFETDALLDIRLIPQSFNAVVSEKALHPAAGNPTRPTLLQFFLEPFNPLSLPAWRKRGATLLDIIRRKP